MFRRVAVAGATAGALLLSMFAAGPSVALAAVSTPTGAFSVAAPQPAIGKPAPKPAPKPATPAKCAGGYTQGSIGGASKCLAAGQQCQQAHVGDYTKYGFSCSKVGARYQLSKRGAVPAKPAVAKGAKPAAKPAATHR